MSYFIDAIGFVGLIMLFYGLYLINPAIAFIVLGIILFSMTVVATFRKR